VVWDTSGLAPGAYVVAGYTWEPVFNIWSQRGGVVKVIDDPDRSKTGPALAISNGEEIKYPDEVLTVVGCVDAMDGSTLTGYWARTDDDTNDVLEWMPFAADTPVEGDSFALPFMPPRGLGGRADRDEGRGRRSDGSPVHGAHERAGVDPRGQRGRVWRLLGQQHQLHHPAGL
jgi:hypothetical protein